MISIGKRHIEQSVWRKSGVQELSPRRVTWMCLTHPAMIVTAHVKCLPERLSAISFYWGLVMKAYSAQHVPKFHLSEGKQVFNIKHIVCTNSLIPVSHSHQLGFWEPPQNPSSQTPAYGQPQKQVRRKQSGLLCYLFPINVLDLVCYYFVPDLSIYIYIWDWPIFSFSKYSRQIL